MPIVAPNRCVCNLRRSLRCLVPRNGGAVHHDLRRAELGQILNGSATTREAVQGGRWPN
jgi:hypothetical protein